MQKISHWSIAGGLAGLIFSIGSFWRYWILFPDHDKAIVYIIVGILVMAVSWLYNKQLFHSNTITALEEYLVDKNERREENGGNNS